MKEQIRELDPLPLSTGPWVCVCVGGGGGGGLVGGCAWWSA